MLVEHNVIVELKAVQELTAIHEAQILSYLKLSGCPVGLLINFNVLQLTEGIKRFRILEWNSSSISRGPPNPKDGVALWLNPMFRTSARLYSL